VRVDREDGFEGAGYRSLRNPRTGEVEKVVGNRARVTASNNVFSPLCVLAARERVEGAGGEQSMPSPRACCYPTWDRACLYTLRNQFRQYCLLRTGHERKESRRKGDEKRVAVSPAAASCPLRILSPCSSLSTRGAVDGFLHSMARHRRSFVFDSRSSFD